MTLDTLLDVMQNYSDLGSAVQEQLRDVISDSDTIGNQNPNAVERFVKFLADVKRQLHPQDDRELRADIEGVLETIADAMK